MPAQIRQLVVILGDQLDRHSAVFDGFDPQHDAVWMAEVDDESRRAWSHPARIVLFLSAMRHFAQALREEGWAVHYRELGRHTAITLAEALREDLRALRPQGVRRVQAGEYPLDVALTQVLDEVGIPHARCVDRHFLCTPEEFAQWASGKREWRMEWFYRWQRQRHQVLMEGKQPLGGQWNFDADNRSPFDARGPGWLPAPRRFMPDDITRDVIDVVRERFADHPGQLDDFDWPLTAPQAEQALDDFIQHRLPLFGRYQDAMWQAEPWLYHARLSAAMNLKLISPRRVIDAAVEALHTGHAPLAAVEGFVRQILGWREYVRGLYWLRMPAFASENALGAEQSLPAFFWTGDTDMACLREVIGQTLRYGYAHHIQRLMVTGLFCLLYGVRPQDVHAWYLAVYVDAVEWVELPNTLGMSQYADGGRLASKPYCASGKYIQRMSNYCTGCRYRPEQSLGETACPITTLYWDFLDRHQARFAKHPRTALQWRNLTRLSANEIAAIRTQAQQLRDRFVATPHSPT